MRHLVVCLIITNMVLCLVLLKDRIAAAVVAQNNKLLDWYYTNGPLVDTKSFPWTREFRENTDVFVEEYNQYLERFHDPVLYSDQIPEVSEGIDQQRKWKTIMLRVFNVDTDCASFFPNTMALLKKAPCSVAMFSVFEPRAKLLPHTGVTKGVLRYHLALKTPEDHDKCFLGIKNKEGKEHRIAWEKGHDYMFDDMFRHWTANNTDETRVVLFLDIERDIDSWILRQFNKWSMSAITHNEKLNERLADINKAFANVRKSRLAAVVQKIFPHFLSECDVTAEDQAFFDEQVEDPLDERDAEHYCRLTAFMRKDDVYSMCSRNDMVQLEYLFERVAANGIHGDFVEAGVWRGGMSMYAQALLFYKHGDLERKVWLLDSFAAFPEDEHEPVDAINRMFRGTQITADTVIDNFKKMNLYRDNVKVLPGYFADTLPDMDSKRISILRLDADLYSSTKLCLEVLYSKVSIGGFVVIDDYNNALLNCKRAVDEFRSLHDITSTIIDVYGGSVFWQKC